MRSVGPSVGLRLPNCTAYDFELLAAGVSGDLACTVEYERATFSMDDGAAEPQVLPHTSTVLPHYTLPLEDGGPVGVEPDHLSPDRGDIGRVDTVLRWDVESEEARRRAAGENGPHCLGDLGGIRDECSGHPS